MKNINASLYKIEVISTESDLSTIETRYFNPIELNSHIEYLQNLKDIGNIESFHVERVMTGFNVSNLPLKDLGNLPVSDFVRIIKDNL